MDNLKENILRTLLYYDIFKHPLNSDEIFKLLPQNSIGKTEFEKSLHEFLKFKFDKNAPIYFKDGYYFVGDNEEYINLRARREIFSRKCWRIARFVTHIIKRFPFVRAVFVTGTLSKNSSLPESDLDFMVVTKAHRLWICRTLLMLFKKIFLFNSYKYFCINYFISEDSLQIEEKNIFTATEIVHIKSTFNSEMMNEFVKANSWIKNFFPNYIPCDNYFNSSGFEVNNRKSLLQKILESFFLGKTADKLDELLRQKTARHWKKKYYHLDEKEREHMFKSTISVSKTHPGNMQNVILNKYRERLKDFNLSVNSNTDYNE
jgi:hypothetical protein